MSVCQRLRQKCIVSYDDSAISVMVTVFMMRFLGRYDAAVKRQLIFGRARNYLPGECCQISTCFLQVWGRLLFAVDDDRIQEDERADCERVQMDEDKNGRCEFGDRDEFCQPPISTTTSPACSDIFRRRRRCRSSALADLRDACEHCRNANCISAQCRLRDARAR